MFEPPSPSQAGDSPGLVHRMVSNIPSKGEATSSNSRGSPTATTRLGRMVDSRAASTARSGADDGAADESSTARVPAAVLANEEKPSPISLSEATQLLDSDDWRSKVSVLRQLQDHLGSLEGGELSVQDSRVLVPLMDSLAVVCRSRKDTTPEIPGAPRVIQLVCAVVSGLAKVVGSGFCTQAAAFIPELLPFLSNPREAVQEAVAGCVEEMLAECHSPGVLRAATVSLVGSKKAYLRRKGSGFLCVAIERWPRDVLRTTLPPIMGQMRKALFDADATVRREGRHTFGVFIRLWPAEGGGMYHALDRANQRAVLQEQPHVSNFISSKASKDDAAGIGVTGSGGGGGATGTAAGASVVTETVASAGVASSAPVASESRATEKSATEAAAAASAAARMVMATGDEGEQRRPGVTHAQHRCHAALKAERERRLKDQARIAAVRVPKSKAFLPSSSSARGFVSYGGGSRTATKFGGGGMSLSSIPAAMIANASCDTAATAATAPAGGGVFGARYPLGSSDKATGEHSPASSCSEGLRRAARLALRKKNLMSPTLQRMLEDPSRLRLAAALAAPAARTGDEESGESDEEGHVSNPESEESGLGEEEGRSSAGIGGNRNGGRFNLADLRGSTTWTLPFSARGSSVGGDSCLSSNSSDEDTDGEEQEGEANSLENARLPTRVLFQQEEDEEEMAPEQQRTSVNARAAANASAARHAALEMKPPPPPLRLPTTSDETGVHHRILGDMSPAPPDGSALSISVNGTPNKGILVTDGSVNRVSVGSSTVKRRVRFEMEKREREAALSAGAHLNSPCRSASSSAPGGWSTANADEDGSDDGESDGGGYQGTAEWWSASLRRVVVSAFAVAVSVGAVASLGRGGVGDGRSHVSPSSSSTSPIHFTWWEQEPKLCPFAPDAGGTGAPSVAVVEKLELVAPMQEPHGGISGTPESQDTITSGYDDKLAEGAPGAGVNDTASIAESSSGSKQAHGADAQDAGHDGSEQQEGKQQQKLLVLEENEGGGEIGAQEAATEAIVAATPKAEVIHERQPSPQDHHRQDHVDIGGSVDQAAYASDPNAADVRGLGQSSVPISRPESPSTPIRASAVTPASVWGWFEVGAAVFVAVVLLTTAFWKSRGGDIGVDEGWDGRGGGEGEGPSTPTNGDSGESELLGRYQTVELVKKGDTPATLRSVNRSRRIGPIQASSSSGIMIMDLGPTALDMSAV